MLSSQLGNGSPMLRTVGLTKVYGGGVEALRSVNLDLHGGHIYGLLGPNGAGKTTFLRICATLLQPTTGDAWIGGKHTVEDAREVRNHLGYLSASTGAYQRLNPVELMRYFGRLYGMTPERIHARTDELFAQLGIDSYRDRHIGKLSTGMRQKVSIARAFLPDPPVLILDEPTNGLDVVVRQALLDMIAAQRHPDRLIVLSTHDLPEAEEICDRYVIIDHGALIAEADESELAGGSLREFFFGKLNEAREQARAS